MNPCRVRTCDAQAYRESPLCYAHLEGFEGYSRWATANEVDAMTLERWAASQARHEQEGTA